MIIQQLASDPYQTHLQQIRNYAVFFSSLSLEARREAGI